MDPKESKDLPDGTRLTEAEIAGDGGLDDGDLSESDAETLGVDRDGK
jgi:hypothetical protein